MIGNSLVKETVQTAPSHNYCRESHSREDNIKQALNIIFKDACKMPESDLRGRILCLLSKLAIYLAYYRQDESYENLAHQVLLSAINMIFSCQDTSFLNDRTKAYIYFMIAYFLLKSKKGYEVAGIFRAQVTAPNEDAVLDRDYLTSTVQLFIEKGKALGVPIMTDSDEIFLNKKVSRVNKLLNNIDKLLNQSYPFRFFNGNEQIQGNKRVLELMVNPSEEMSEIIKKSLEESLQFTLNTLPQSPQQALDWIEVTLMIQRLAILVRVKIVGFDEKINNTLKAIKSHLEKKESNAPYHSLGSKR
jgi:hypothetical protein